MKSIHFYIYQAKINEKKQKLSIAQFIDDFLKEKNTDCLSQKIIDNDPISKLFEATAHQLCLDQKLIIPNWLLNPIYLSDPFFVSKLENSKFLALRDSPYAFRIRNIFVPYHYLSRA